MSNGGNGRIAVVLCLLSNERDPHEAAISSCNRTSGLEKPRNLTE